MPSFINSQQNASLDWRTKQGALYPLPDIASRSRATLMAISCINFWLDRSGDQPPGNCWGTVLSVAKRQFILSLVNRTPVVTLVGLNVGYDVPRKYCEKNRCIPSGITVRIQNIGNQILPISFGGQWQTTRYTVPLQVLVEMNWGYGASGTGSHT